MDDVCWQIEEHEATLRCGPLAARIDLWRPNHGLASLTLNNDPVAGGRILAAEVPEVDAASHSLADYYHRGIDVVATYAATDAWPFRTQLYWRAGRCRTAPSMASVELVASVQTNLLDSQPRLLVGSNLAAVEVRKLADPIQGCVPSWQPVHESVVRRSVGNQCSCTLLRLPNGLGSYVEMVHPIDFGQTELTRSGPAGTGDASLWSLRHALFAAELEKGVILRARVLAAFIGRDDDEAQAARLYREFAASEPPLTT